MMPPKILVPLAPGFEEIEAVTIIDILRRAGAELTVAAQQNEKVTGSHGITILADTLLASQTDRLWDWIIIPGGTEGVNHLLNDENLTDILKKQQARQGNIAAICAAPLILDKAGIPGIRTITIHPAVAPKIKDSKIQNEPVIRQERLITGRSAGAAMLFALTLVKEIFGTEKLMQVNKGVMAELPAKF
jgi:protein deglycase